MTLTDDQLGKLRRQLLDKGKELADQLAALLAGQKPSGLDLLTAEPGETDEEKLRRYLGVVQGRIDALRAGSYGKCESCGQEIPAEELAQLPWADRCGRCAATATG